MTKHLMPDEIVAALDSALEADRMRHVDDCDACRNAIAEMREVVGDLRTGQDVPEPSPLFWDHFSARVRAATNAEPMAAPAWWQFGWRPMAVAGAAVVAVALVIVMRDAPDVAREPAPMAGAATVMRDADVDDTWNTMARMASSLSSDDVHLVVASAAGSNGTISDLTPAERRAFVSLLNGEMGGTQ